ncbi:hypothetical protein IAI10_16175 [Clostridium sp. 19966]|uniref:DUF5659 domain-containing protein n=1 Tax=Clostridium sp. 19966 TaxID=2768166 RepID=UPI0028DDDD4B|nr:DUF5659 domain-containing protein [Clostridium sp. 19966]MDT8718204.1 hypothetical protein [Clostridium sp. 19966]
MELRPISDKDLLVFLVAKGLEIKDIKKEKDKNRSLVYFEDTDKLNQAMLQFANKSEQVNISDVLAAERRVKTLLCMQKN